MGLSLALAMPPGAIAPAYGAELTEWRFDPTTRQLELSIPGGTTPNYFLLAQPARIVLDLPNTTVSTPLEEQTYSGVVRSIRVSQFQPTLTRIVIELSPDAELAPSQVELRQVSPPDTLAREQWIVRPLLAGDAPVAAIEPVPPIPAPDGLDTAPEEADGVTFEAATGVTNGSNDDINGDDSNGDDPAEPQGVDLLDQGERSDERAIAPADAAGIDALDDRLPPLEPGAFEIPVEIPPPLPELEEPPDQSVAVSGAADGEADVDLFTDDLIVDAPDEEESASLPVAIAPPASPPTDDEARESDATREEVTEENTPSTSASTSQNEGESAPSEQEVIRTPDDLERVLTDALPAGTNVTVVGREEESSPSQQPENELEPLAEDADMGSPVPPEPSQFLTPRQDTDPQEETSPFPSPEDDEAESFAVSPIEAEFLSALPPAQSTIDLPVTVTVPSPGKADDDEEDEDIAAPSDSETPSSETAPNDPNAIANASQWNIQPDSTRPGPEPGQTTRGQQSAPPPTDPAVALNQPSSSALPPASPPPPVDDAPVNVIEFGQPIDGQPLPPPLPGQIAPEQSARAPQPTAFPSPSSPQRQPALAAPSATATSRRQLIIAARPDAMIPSGTVLRLRYPRLTPTLLRKGIAWQDVLLLEQTLLDPNGNVIAIEGTPVIGRFEITPQYVRFVTQAIALDDRNIPLQAISGWVPVPVESTAVVIQPNQIVNVRLAENFDR